MVSMWSRECLLVLGVLISHCKTILASSTPPMFIFSLTSQIANSKCISLFHMQVRSRTECAATCGYSSVCMGVSYVLPGGCFHVQENCSLNSSSSTDDLFVYMKHIWHPCLHQGTWNRQIGACSCIKGWVGFGCQRRAYRCQELLTFGYPVGRYDVNIDVYKNQSLMAYTQCEVGANYWRTFIFSSDASGDYNRTWADYEHGFRDGRWNQWLGLRNIYAFNQMGHVTVTFSVVVQGGRFIWEFVYENFRILDATSGYAFTYSRSFNRTFGTYYLTPDDHLADVLALTQGMPFSTFDMDRDHDNENCAALQGAGWWIDTCTTGQAVNPLGLNPRSWPSVSELNKLLIPGIDISKQAIMDNFQSVFMTFTD